MKTYSTYQGAKIANPECEIYSVGISEFTTEKPMHGWTASGLLCNPVDYCMTVEQFLKAGNKFEVGDLWIDYDGDFMTVGKPGVNHMNKPHERDFERYILRAAALKTHPDIHKDSEFYKKPRTKVEFVNVEDSIFDLKYDYENGNLYHSGNGDDFNKLKGDERTVARCLIECTLYRRIETPMTEKEAFIDAYAWAVQDDKSNVEDIAGMLFNSGKFKLVN